MIPQLCVYTFCREIKFKVHCTIFLKETHQICNLLAKSIEFKPETFIKALLLLQYVFTFVATYNITYNKSELTCSAAVRSERSHVVFARRPSDSHKVVILSIACVTSQSPRSTLNTWRVLDVSAARLSLPASQIIKDIGNMS